MNVFAHNAYKEFFRAYLDENPHRGAVSQLAAACGCDRTYISQVLSGKADLTPDHLIQFCDHMNFTESEGRYLLLLLLRDRAASPRARRSFETRLASLKREASVLSKKIYDKEKPGEIKEELKTLYYSKWIYGAVHILTSIPEYQTVAALSEKLSVSSLVITRVLKDLVEMGVVLKEKDKYVHGQGNLYLPVDAPQIHSHHFNWRMKAIERSGEKEDVHYTTIFSVSKSDVEKLRSLIVQFIDKQRTLVQASGTEAAYALCCDFFEV